VSDGGRPSAGGVRQLLEGARTILLVDWPSRDVPDTLARHGFAVVSHDGPGDADYNAYVPDGDPVRVHPVGRRPDRADLVYSHRPLDEWPDIAAMAKELGAKAVWIQSGRDATGARDARGCWLPDEDARVARGTVERAGLVFVDRPYIADAARRHPLR
jgi:predicted CoA-binding protein